MNRGMKIAAIAALTMAASAMTQGLFANCVSEGPYEVRQCSKGAWFGPKPATAGAHIMQWWAIGFGNGTLASTAAETVGTGIGLTPLPGTFIGVDNGSLDAVGLDLVDAASAGIGAPPSTLCFSASANWGSPGLDSCIDINRNDVSGNGAAAASDNIVNKYWDSALAPNPPGPYDYEYFNHQLDPPMGVLLTETTGQFFAVAFFASTPKLAPRQSDPDLGQYSMGEIRNGDTGPTGPNIIPWQQVPQPSVAAQLSDPLNPLSPRNLTFNWTLPRFVHDQSTRPCIQSDMLTPCTSLGNATGVGVMDQGPLFHFEVETSPIDATGACGAVWTSVPGSRVEPPVTQAVVNGVPPDTCVRMKTSLGKTPQAAMRTAPLTVATRTLNQTDAERGLFGDIGFTVASTPVKVGGTLVSQKATLNAAGRQKGALHVAFSTDTELNVTGFDVVGIDGRGGRKVLGSVACKQCTTGLGASYDELISGAKVGGAKKVQIVMQPSGAVSNTLDLK